MIRADIPLLEQVLYRCPGRPGSSGELWLCLRVPLASAAAPGSKAPGGTQPRLSIFSEESFGEETPGQYGHSATIYFILTELIKEFYLFFIITCKPGVHDI